MKIFAKKIQDLVDVITKTTLSRYILFFLQPAPLYDKYSVLCTIDGHISAVSVKK